VALAWDEMRNRLHRVPGFEGEANKRRRKEWIAGALGYRLEHMPANLFTAYQRADAEQLGHVEALLLHEERRGAAGLRAYRAEMATGECLCAEIDPSDRPCLTCEALADIAKEQTP
jgi:hypothetical protein